MARIDQHGDERRMSIRAALAAPAVLLLLFTGAACSRQDTPLPRDETPAASAPAAAPSSDAPRIVFLGDSLTAGLGVSPDDAYPALIGRRLHDAGLGYEVVNAGVSGDTSAGGVRRLDWSLAGDVRLLVIAIGANDGLRGLPTSELRQNLATMIETAGRRGIPVLLAGMEAPPNFGAEYTRDFRAVYGDLARTYHVRLIPFYLDGVAGHAALNQADGIHPNVQGHRVVADLMWREIEPMLAARQTR